ncbi:MAG: phosphocarrier protein HPr [Legionellaceae bacterium]|nr:phosphocarrier protein HPr [Legionellaceae bacterium]HAF87832.1 HPr family phosphocarrier protein [Legionellales bacterium]HCA89082.1 HPr family phosphocarrier protein [Legionellales bacterium]|tara:strand:- start:1351 stop:1620 length:270 start_codon:yes stop_codon:yes gene_type:complete
MIRTTVSIINMLGLHARASAKFVATAARFQSAIEVSKGNQTVDGKSIMGVMMLAAPKGCDITLSVDGPDEKDMTNALVKLINERFGEPQ